jgi:lysozyme
MNSFYLDAIKKFEGFAQRAEWDYAQHTNGYGTRALFPGEVIDRAEAERRFQIEIKEARAIVERNAPDADEGTKAALTSLTFNAGDKWTRSGLGEALRQGDTETARELFLQYNKAGGQALPGLVARRAAEAEWFGNPQAGSTASDAAGTARSVGVDTAGNFAIAKSPDAMTAVAEIPLHRQDGSGRVPAPVILASADPPTGKTSATNVPEQRFAQQASALLMLMQLEKTPLLPDRSQVNDRDEQRKSTQNSNVTRA